MIPPALPTFGAALLDPVGTSAMNSLLNPAEAGRGITNLIIMRSPLENSPWVEIQEVASTQTHMAELLSTGAKPGVVFAHHQTDGKGRFEREWYSEQGGSLTMSLAFHEYANHPKPWLIGMAVAVAASGVLHCKLAWPNDLMSGTKKIGGILTEIMPGGIPVVGVGVNLNLAHIPKELQDRATNQHSVHTPLELARAIVARLETLPEPAEWSDLRPVWMLFDATPGKHYKLPSGENALAIGIGPEGELIGAVDGETTSVMAAEAIFG